ncbi:MAG: hypothetical protein IJF21_03620 [Clostridia bacterium]|nr:hypothetical protein [Clostridia bacterium]MBQ3229178.1 hypothetical protein [Clostridia bacterium]
MKIKINRPEKLGKYIDPTRFQNSTLRYSPPEDFPAYMAGQIGRAEVMRVWITLDEYWDYRTGEFYPDYDIGVARYPAEELHYPYDWKNIVPAPSGTRFKAYLTSHAKEADELLLNVRRLEREVSDGVITYDQYETIFEKSVEYCKELAPNIRYIECCNEVDIRSFGLLNAEEYVKIYLCAHRAVKRLNKKHNYELPLELGGFAAAHPIAVWDMMREIVGKLKAEGVEMQFYSYHHYDSGATMDLVSKKKYEVAKLSGVDKLKHLLKLHNEMLADFGLPKRKVFLNELGKARTTGIDGDSLYNAAGNITYLLAFGCDEEPELCPFPWCTFHNPKLQISFTQFLLCEDGSYAMTPNGVAIKMLHDLRGERLSASVSEALSRDAEYCTVAVEDEGGISVIVVNTSGETIIGELAIEGMPAGDYSIKGHLCDSNHNNVVTGKTCTGKAIDQTAEALRKVGEDGVFKHIFSLEKNAFTLYRIEKYE